MSAQIIDGKALAQTLRAQVAEQAAALAARGSRPGLAVILVGDDPASAVYVRNKVKACEEAGIHSVLERYDASMTQAALLERIAALNADGAIHGILVQMPLPGQMDVHRVIEAIAPAKDVDGFSVTSAGELMTGLPGLRPATPAGCMKLIESTGQSIRGKHAARLVEGDFVHARFHLVDYFKEARRMIHDGKVAGPEARCSSKRRKLTPDRTQCRLSRR